VDDVRPFMNRAAVYVCPIRDGGGTKLKLLDAFSMEQCVVAHPIACEGLSVVQGVHVELADTARSFADSTLQLLREPARRESMGRAARRLVEERYSFDEIAAQLCEVLESSAVGAHG
jgi:glycosyltransferase involved in cell wall biosynthesis